MQPRALLIESFRAAVAAADPQFIVPAHLPAPPAFGGRTLVIGAGKAAASMAAAVEAHWPKQAPLEGLVITRYGHGLPLTRIRCIEAGHPIPDDRGEEATRTLLSAVQSLGPKDQLIALISGGGSSLLSLPAEGIRMQDLKAVTAQLLSCGAMIQEINVVRKHLSLIQGGRLAAACRAPILALIISDVTGDDPTHIASGPCSPDPSTYADALAILNRYAITAPTSVLRRLEAGAAGAIHETPKPGNAVFARCENRVIATPQRSLTAAAAVFSTAGVTPIILGDSIIGEAREVGKVFAGITQHIVQHHAPFKPPVALISGGECTVTVKNTQGRGGRCSTFLLSLAIELNASSGVYAIAADTDGIDGSESNAGAVIEPTSLALGDAASQSARACLDRDDAWGFFSAIDGLVTTGPTLTNVNDYRAILIQ